MTSLALNPSNDTFLSASLDNTLRLWDLRSLHSTGLLHLTTPYLTAYDPTASVIAVACLAAKTVLLYDVRNYAQAPFASFEVGEIEEAVARHPSVQKAGGVGKWTKLEFGNDGSRILIATNGAGHVVLDAFEGEFVCYCLRSAGGTGRIPPSDVGLVRGAGTGTGAKPNGAGVAALQARKGGPAAATGQGDACMTPDGRYVLGGAGEAEILVWDVAKPVESMPADRILRPIKELAGGAAVGKQNRIVAYDPRFNVFAAADRNLVFWQPDLE